MKKILLKIGDAIVMRPDSPRYLEQGKRKDGSWAKGIITDVYTSELPYRVSWDNGRKDYYYSDDHIKLAEESVVNNYPIY
jgi:hypothetical protein